MVRTINQTYQAQYQAEKNRKIFRKIFLFLVLFLAAVGGITYALFFSNFFNVREITINNRGLAGNSEVRSVVESYLAEKNFYISKFSNLFLVNPDRISALVGERFPAAENIKVEKDYWHGLKISLSQKEAAGVWCYQKNNQCAYFDRLGLSFETITNTLGPVLLRVSDYQGRLKELGQPVADQHLLDLIFQAQAQLKKRGISITKFIIPETEDFRVDIQTSEGWKIYLSINDDLTKQLNNLVIFLAQKITAEKRAQLVYIDLTIPNRVYYK